MTFSTIKSALAADVAPAGTFTASYPLGKNPGTFQLSMAHKLMVGDDAYFFPVDFDVTFNASNMTITNKTSAVTWGNGKTTILQMEEMGERSQLDYPLQYPNPLTGTIAGVSYRVDVKARLIPSSTDCYFDLISLGAPITLDTGAVCAAQSLAALGNLVINGTQAVSGAVTIDVPRALQIVSSGADTAVLTITGTDVYGRAMSEAITLNGTTAVLGKKAFKTVSQVAGSAAIANLAKVGTQDVLGIPVFIPSEGFVVAELQNGHPVGNTGATQIPFLINQVDLLASTPQNFVSPVAGFLTGMKVIVNKNSIVTGGTIQVAINGVNVTGLVATVANSALPGAVSTKFPTTPFSATTVVKNGDRITITPAAFATSGDVTGYVEAIGTNGILVSGIRTAGGSTTTTGDTRGTYKPSAATDGATFFHILVCLGDRYPGISQNVAGA